MKGRHARQTLLKPGPSSVCGSRKRRVPKTSVAPADLNQAESAALNSLSSVDAQRGYGHAIEAFIEWYCSKPRLSFTKTVDLRWNRHKDTWRLYSSSLVAKRLTNRRMGVEMSLVRITARR